MTTHKNKKLKISKTDKAIVSDTVRDYGNEAFFIKKAEKAAVTIKKYGFPQLPEKKG